MIYKYADKKEVFRSKDAVGFQLADSSSHEFVNLIIQPKGTVPAHALPVPVSFFVINGNGELTLNQHKIPVEKGDVIEVPENESREWNNPFDLPLELLVIKNKSVNV